jgi:hypothetical protein
VSAVVLPFLRPDRELCLLRLIVGDIPVDVVMTEDDLSVQDRIALAQEALEPEKV